MKNKLRKPFALGILSLLLLLTACSSSQEASTDKKIIRIGHNQSQNHPTHIGMLAFEDFIEENLGDKYDIQLFPSELLGTQTNMVQLTQTGAVEITVASNSILETFNDQFEIFNLPYLFDSEEAYHAAMDDPEIVGDVFEGTRESGFVTKAWLDAGIRNFYVTDKPINEPSDLKGLKIRVQQSPTNVRMMQLLGGSATPMGFGDVYTAIQSGVINGAENNELALTENGHGDVVNYYSYTMHQMIPDEVIVNVAFLDSLDDEEEAIFEEAFQIMQDTQHASWKEKVEVAKETAQNKMGVTFNYPEIKPFRDTVLPLHEETLERNPTLKPVYEAIQEKVDEVNKKMEGEKE